jgi:hypothetical protein
VFAGNKVVARQIALLSTTLVLLSGCGSDSANPEEAIGGVTSPEAAESPSPSPSPTAEAPPTFTAEPSPSIEEGTGLESPSTDAGGFPSEGPAVLPTSAVGKVLTLADIFQYDDDWTDSRFSVADRMDVPGIGVELTGCGEDYGRALELRLARGFSRLAFNAGQDNTSASSDEQLIVAVIANGGQIDIRRVPFDRIQPFALDVKDVNALKIVVWLDQEQGCQDYKGATAVIEQLTLT